MAYALCGLVKPALTSMCKSQYINGHMYQSGKVEADHNPKTRRKIMAISHVVVPVDFMANTNILVEYANSMAKTFSASLHFVHVVSVPEADTMVGIPFAAEYKKNMLADGQAKMTDLIEENSKKKVISNCTGEVVTGDPADKIVKVAEKKDSDLIIIGTHGAKGLEKILLGSVAERVLKRAHCPVLIMNPYKTR